MNFREILRALEKLPKPSQAELARAARMLRQAGYSVTNPTSPVEPSGWNQGKISGTGLRQPAAERRLPLPGWQERPQVERAPTRDTSQDDLLQGQMFAVSSSNVHSIGMRIDAPGQTQGTLMVRFLATREGGVRLGPGSLYGYYEVPVRLFREFQHASSKGKFVWDELRVRGTISGHRYNYALIGVVGQFAGGQHRENYVPRQAALKRGQSGEHFIPRTFRVTGLGTRGPSGMFRMGTRPVRSQLSPAVASLRGPNPDRGPGPDALRFNP